MALSIKIGLHFAEDEEPGFCSSCGDILVKKFVPMVQIGDVTDGHMTPLNHQLCEKCYKAFLPQNPDDPPSTDNI